MSICIQYESDSKGEGLAPRKIWLNSPTANSVCVKEVVKTIDVTAMQLVSQPACIVLHHGK